MHNSLGHDHGDLFAGQQLKDNGEFVAAVEAAAAYLADEDIGIGFL